MIECVEKINKQPNANKKRPWEASNGMTFIQKAIFEANKKR